MLLWLMSCEQLNVATDSDADISVNEWVMRFPRGPNSRVKFADENSVKFTTLSTEQDLPQK